MKFVGAILLLTGLLLAVGANAQKTSPDPGIRVRDGFTLSVVQNSLENPRFMAFDDQGTLYVSFPDGGEIISLKDKDNDGYYETVKTFVTGYPTIQGMYFHDGWLWFTQSGAILKAIDTDHDGAADKTETVIAKGALPEGGGHWWRPLLIHNNRLFTAIGCS